jgi:hypothetical protein
LENATLAPTPCSTSLSASSATLLAKVTEFEQWSLANVPQVDVPTEHLLHGGMYARTLRIPAGTVVTGSFIKIPTILIFHGHAEMLTGAGWATVDGYGVLAGSAFRKQICVARTAVEVTMVFPTNAKTVEEAEREFTDEYEKLMSRKSAKDEITMTGE